MERIGSFSIDHDILKEGMYLSKVQDDIKTYDIRMRIPNGGDYLDTPGMHTMEHLFATFVRNTEYADKIVYVGPMGCRTGFYFLTRDLPNEAAIRLIQNTMEFVANFSGEIPGAKRKECGNYKEHNLLSAKAIASRMIPILKNWTVEQLEYPTEVGGNDAK